jgi:hypothetical protein
MSHPPAHPEQIRDEIMASFRTSVSGLGLCNGVVGVRIWADQVGVAATLHQRYGDAVSIVVGYLPYPDIESGDADLLAARNRSHETATLSDEVSLSLEKGIEIRSGSHLRSQLTIRNESSIELLAGKLVPTVVDPSNGRTVGGYEGAITMEMRRYEVPAGTMKGVPIIIGTASTRPELGWAVPPGLWAIRVLLQLGDRGFQRLVPILVAP